MKKREWVNTEVEKPSPKKFFDMCLLDLGEKIINGWWTGTSWDGLNYSGQEVKRWKYSGNEGMTMS